MRLKIFVVFLFYSGLCVNAQKQFPKIIINKDIELTQISDSIFIHTSWFEFPKFGRFPSNGMILVKSSKSKSLGNLADAVVNDWDNSVKKLIDEFADAKVVVPGHGRFGGKN